MRDILFRGKRTDINKFVYGYLYGVYDGYCDILDPDKGIYSVIKDTVGQYIEKEDKEEISIFEGDILQSLHFKEGNKKHYLIHYVAWNEEMMTWYAVNKDSKDLKDGCCPLWVYLKNSKEIKIIGDIFDNPELLGK